MYTSCRKLIAATAVWAGMGVAPQAAADGTVNLDLRLRYEQVQQDSTLRDADALTLRTRLGYTTAAWNALTAFVEMESVSALVDDYAPENDGYAVVADPAESEVNQYGLRYAGVPGLLAVLGRSRLILDNARWIGNVGWRQNEQTFDGAFFKYTGTGALTAQYAWLSKVNTITATSVDIDGHLLNLGWAALPQLTLSGYAYLLDYEAAATPDLETWGLRAAGRAPLGDALRLGYAAEYARQRADTESGDFDADYLLGELGVTLGPATAVAGYEVLGSDGGRFGVQTPLATKHAFQGWADVFLATPAAGVRDGWLGFDIGHRRLKLVARYHRLRADRGGTDYGDEIDVSASLPLWRTLAATLKLARYRADDFGVDTDKLWLQFDYRL